MVEGYRHKDERKLVTWIERTMPGHFFFNPSSCSLAENYTPASDLIENYDEIMTKFRVCYNKNSNLKYSFDQIRKMMREGRGHQDFFDCILVGDAGDRDECLFEYVSEKDLDFGLLLVEISHTGNTMLDEDDVAAEEFWNRMHEIRDEIQDIARRAMFRDSRYKDKIVILTEWEYPEQAMWLRYLKNPETSFDEVRERKDGPSLFCVK